LKSNLADKEFVLDLKKQTKKRGVLEITLGQVVQ
jgi:hypothetical protein